MLEYSAWIDEVINYNSYKVCLYRKPRELCNVEFRRLEDACEGENNLQSKCKNALRESESRHVYNLLKNIFADHLAPDCIDQLKKFKYCFKNAEDIVPVISKKEYEEYKAQTDKFYTVFSYIELQLITGKYHMSGDFVVEIAALCEKIKKTKDYFLFTFPVSDTVDNIYSFVVAEFYSYVLLIKKFIDLKKRTNKKFFSNQIKHNIFFNLRNSLNRNEFVFLYPEIDWKQAENNLVLSSETTSVIVNQIYEILERDTNIFLEDNPSPSIDYIIYEKLLMLLESHKDKYQKRYEEDKNFSAFIDVFKSAVDVLSKSLRIANETDWDNALEEEQGPGDFVSVQEVVFLRTIYNLAYKKRIPFENIKWYETDKKTIDTICNSIDILAKYKTIYRYVNANYTTLWEIIENIKTRLKCPIAHNICRMIDRFDLGIDTYHDIYKKLGPAHRNDILAFEESLKKTYSSFNSLLGKAYVNVLSERERKAKKEEKDKQESSTVNNK